MTTKIRAAIVRTATSNSFFGKLSKKLDDRVILYVYKHVREPLYYVLAYTPRPVSSETISENLRNDYSRITKITKHVEARETHILAIKERCEFYELVESYGVILSVPYVIQRGQRIYCIYGELGSMDKYIDNLVAAYGKNNVAVRITDFTTCIDYQIKNIVSSYVMSFLTDKEKQILIKAFESGYISSRRRVKLGELADYLNIAKPTASLMLRRAIEKVIKRIVEAE